MMEHANRQGPIDSAAWLASVGRHPGRVSNAHWPHFSLRPGVWRMSAIREVRTGLRRYRGCVLVQGLLNAIPHAQVGPLPVVVSFEYIYAIRYHEEHGYRTAFFLDPIYCLHLGTPVSTFLRDERGRRATEDYYLQQWGVRHVVPDANAYSLNDEIR